MTKIAIARGIYEKEKGSGVWWIRWTDAAGRKRREKVGRRSDAKDVLAKRKSEKLQQQKLPEVFGRSLLFSELLDDAVEHSKAENGDRSTHELKLKIDRLRPEWSDRKVRDITKQEIVRWLQAEAVKREWTPATMNRWQACFSLVFRVGLDNEKIAVNPAARIRRKTENNQRIRFLLPGEEKRLRKVLASRTPSYLHAFIISLHTGIRASEQWGLKWCDVDFERQILTVRTQKSGKGPRHVKLNGEALKALRHLRAGTTDEGPVFINSINTPMTNHRDWFDRAVADANIADYTWHCNRHTFASRLAMSGCDILTISKLMGHGTIQMSARYSHLSPDHQQSAVDRLVGFGKKGTLNRTPAKR